MKIKIFLMAIAIFGLFSCSNKNPRAIVEIPEMKEGHISIIYAKPNEVSVSNESIIFSSEFKDGKISINFDSIEFEKDFIEAAMIINSNDNKTFINLPLPLEKGEKIEVKITNIEGYNRGDKIDISYAGSKHAEDFTAFWNKMQKQILSFRNAKLEDINQEYANFVPIYKSYIEKYPQSGFPYMLLMSLVGNMQFENANPLLDYCNTLCANAKDNQWKEMFCSLLGEKKLALETSTKLVFNAVDINGKNYSERDIKGKLIILDFWASWCKPCREEIPHLKAIYNKYKSKGLEIISISIDKTYNEWKNYIKENPFNWLSLYGDGQSLTKRYDFEYIPYNIIADENGNIIQKNLHDKELDAYLQNFFSK